MSKSHKLILGALALLFAVAIALAIAQRVTALSATPQNFGGTNTSTTFSLNSLIIQGSASYGGLPTGTAGSVLGMLNGSPTYVATSTLGLQAPGNYLTALTGDGTASGPGSVAFTLATVNANVGTFGNASTVPVITVNSKGLVTAVSTSSIYSNMIVGELVAGSGTTWNLANTPISGSEEIFARGQLLTAGAGNDYVLSGNVITTANSFSAGDLKANYRK